MKRTKHNYPTIGKVRLVREPSTIPQKIVTSSMIVNEVAKELFTDTNLVEYFYMLSLNRANMMCDSAKISQGGLTGTVVDIRLIAKIALDTLATSVVFIHNHPSGNAKPSEQDISLTKKMKEALALLDIVVLDHIIIVPNGDYYSFMDQGIL